MTARNRKFEFLTRKKIRKTPKARAKKAEPVIDPDGATIPNFLPAGMTQEQWNTILEMIRRQNQIPQDQYAPYIPYSEYPGLFNAPYMHPSDRIYIGDPLPGNGFGTIMASGTGAIIAADSINTVGIPGSGTGVLSASSQEGVTGTVQGSQLPSGAAMSLTGVVTRSIVNDISNMLADCGFTDHVSYFNNQIEDHVSVRN